LLAGRHCPSRVESVRKFLQALLALLFQFDTGPVGQGQLLVLPGVVQTWVSAAVMYGAVLQVLGDAGTVTVPRDATSMFSTNATLFPFAPSVILMQEHICWRVVAASPCVKLHDVDVRTS